jgi:hypothetical protein
MLPAAYATPAAAVVALGGLLACFAGFRLFRIVLGLYGGLIGAALMIARMDSPSLWMLVLAALVGGVIGAVLAIVAYFMAVGLVGAGLSAFALIVAWRFFGGDPPTVVLVVGCVLGALAALSIVRYVVVFGTALAGAWTFMVGALALMGDPQAMQATSAGDVWSVLPIHAPADRWWMTAGWAVMALAGVVVQLRTSKRGGKEKKSK